MDELAWVIVLGLATWQIVEVLHHSKITLSVRRWSSKSLSVQGFRGFLAQLIECPFCHAHWIAGALVLFTAIPLALGCPWTKPIVYIFAAVRLANLGNDVFYELCKTPKHDVEEIDEIVVEEGPSDDNLERPGTTITTTTADV